VRRFISNSSPKGYELSCDAVQRTKKAKMSLWRKEQRDELPDVKEKKYLGDIYEKKKPHTKTK
jgi:hypothetical protein